MKKKLLALSIVSLIAVAIGVLVKYLAGNTRDND